MSAVRPRRRHLLIGGAAALIARPFVRVARGQDAQVRRGRYFMVFYYPHNTRTQWYPTGGETDFRLPSIMAPLEPIRQHVTFFGNVIAKSSKRGWENHLGVNHILTAHGTRDDALGPSLDQVLADHWGAQAPTPVKSLHVWSAPPQNNTSTPSWRGFKQPVLPERSPQEAFKLVFANAASGLSPADLMRIESRRRSILDGLKSELGDLSRALGKDEARMLDAHLESVREVERNLFAKGTAEAPAGSCSTTKDAVATGGTSYPAVLKAHMDVAVAAIACGTTRVAVIQGGDQHNSHLTFPWIGVNATHHLGIQHGESPGWDKVSTWYLEQFAYLLQSLKRIPTSSGTLLDEGLVMHTTPFGFGHSPYGLPYLLGGHAGGRIKGGQLVQTGQASRGNTSFDGGADVGDLLLTCAHALGMTHLKSFGDATYSKGLLPGLLQPA